MPAKTNVYRALGLMSGTSVDGMDAAIIETDGNARVKVLARQNAPYSKDLREALLDSLGASVYNDELREIERQMTRAHARLVDAIIESSGTRPDLIGFHGQTLSHDPDNGHTLQIGDGELLAQETGIDVINDFRKEDVKAGGQGAPFLPLYHKALVQNAGIDLPVVILNLGGVANVTWIGPDTNSSDDNILAFDTGPASALIDDWISSQTDQSYDKDGAIAAKGEVDHMKLQAWLDHDYFAQRPPKSLDRDDWDHCRVDGMSLEDGAATLTAFTVQSIVRASAHFPAPAPHWYASGGGRHNTCLMEELQKSLAPSTLHKVDDLGWNGDFIEAEGFAYLAVRSKAGLPLSVPGTTGVPRPVCGGVYHKAPKKAA